MRQVTATEKYRAVLEGKMAKREFVRQMRQQHPQHITQFNGFDDSVQILKNRGLLFESKPTQVKIYDERPALNYSLDALDRGIRAELGAMGIELGTVFNRINPEDFLKAEKKAKDNLEKNPTHYLDLIAGESDNVDKHDKDTEVKRGEGKVDVFNGLKKADLREAKVMLKEGRLEDLAKRLGVPVDKLKAAADKIRDMEREKAQRDALKVAKMEDVLDEVEVDEEVEVNETPILKEVLASAIGKIKEKYGEIPGINSLIKDFIKTHAKDIMDGADPIHEFDNFVEANYDRIDEADKDDLTPLQKHVYNYEKDISGHEEAENFLDDIKKLKTPDDVHDYYANERGWEGDKDLADDLDNIYNQVKDKFNEAMYDLDDDGNDHIFGKKVYKEKKKDHDGDGDIDSDDYLAAKDKAIKKAMGKDKEANEQFKPKRLKKVTVGGKTYEKGELDPDDDGRILRIEKFPNGYFITASTGREGYGYAIDLKGNEIDEDDLEGIDDYYNEEKYKRVGGNKVYLDTDGEEIVDEELDLPQSALTRINTDIKNPKTMAQSILQYIDAVDDKEDPSLFKNQKLARALDMLKDLADDPTQGFDKDVNKAVSKGKLRTGDIGVNEAIKKLIKKVLKEDTLNEAATNSLAALADSYGGFKGMQVILNDLENIVTDIESYHARTQEKLQSVFNKVGQVENEEGLKVGGFLAPAIEAAFVKDLRPVTRKGYMKGVDIPKVQFLPKDVKTPSMEETPKRTVFGPNENNK